MAFDRRIWIDVTGIAPASDAAVFARLLGDALGRVCVVAPALCARAPGLREMPWSEFAAPVASGGMAPQATGWGRRLADLLPAEPRRALARAISLQSAAVRAARRSAAPAPSEPAPPTPLVDQARPAEGDVLLMLGAYGDASRFADADVRLVAYPVDLTPMLRPDFLSREAQAAHADWMATTAGRLEAAMSGHAMGAMCLERAGCAGVAIIPAAASLDRGRSRNLEGRVQAPGFVLAAGPVGVAGCTPQLLLAWRRLMEHSTGGDMPRLVLAGEIGGLSADVLSQLRYSDGLGGHISFVASPGPAAISDLLRDCLFCIATDAGSGWGRAVLDSGAAGVPCLSAIEMPDVSWVDAGNAAIVAREVQHWIDAPPPRAVASVRSWDEMAADLLGVLDR